MAAARERGRPCQAACQAIAVLDTASLFFLGGLVLDGYHAVLEPGAAWKP